MELKQDSWKIVEWMQDITILSLLHYGWIHESPP